MVIAAWRQTFGGSSDGLKILARPSRGDSEASRSGQMSAGGRRRRGRRAAGSCQADPSRPHGPYYQLTRKIAGKTITRRLNDAQAARYAEWTAGQREQRRLLTEMQAISRQATELILQQDTPKHPKHRETSPAKTGPHPRRPC